MKRQEIISFVFFVFMNKLKLVCNDGYLEYDMFSFKSSCDEGLWFFFSNIPAKPKAPKFKKVWFTEINNNKHILERISNG